jgi:hypothetical protein
VSIVLHGELASRTEAADDQRKRVAAIRMKRPGRIMTCRDGVNQRAAQIQHRSRTGHGEAECGAKFEADQFGADRRVMDRLL